MEINKYSDIVGVVATETIPEGRMVLLVPHSQSHNYGSQEDLEGVKLPDTSDEAAEARYVLTHAVDTQKGPIFREIPSYPFAFRQGMSVSPNVPFTATVHMTQPSMKEGIAIPSGYIALAFGGRGVFTVPSGAYMYDAQLEDVGANLVVADTASDSEDDAGKLKYSATAGVAKVVRFDQTDASLTFRILY